MFKMKAEQGNDYVSSPEEALKKLSFYSARMNKPMTGDIKKEFYSLGMDINFDGKLSYLNNLTSKL